jgi:hypothetical protein
MQCGLAGQDLFSGERRAQDSHRNVDEQANRLTKRAAEIAELKSALEKQASQLQKMSDLGECNRLRRVDSKRPLNFLKQRIFSW